MGFWGKAERVRQYKLQSLVEARRKEVLDKHLEFLVGQTQKYSSMLAQRLTSAPDDALAATPNGAAPPLAIKGAQAGDTEAAAGAAAAGGAPQEQQEGKQIKQEPGGAKDGDGEEWRAGAGDDEEDDEATLEEEEVRLLCSAILSCLDREFYTLHLVGAGLPPGTSSAARLPEESFMMHHRVSACGRRRPWMVRRRMSGRSGRQRRWRPSPPRRTCPWSSSWRCTATSGPRRGSSRRTHPPAAGTLCRASPNPHRNPHRPDRMLGLGRVAKRAGVMQRQQGV